jgi:hypothetical protein
MLSSSDRFRPRSDIRNPIRVTTSQTIDPSYDLYIVNASAGDVTLTVPLMANLPVSKEIWVIMEAAAGTCHVVLSGAELFTDGLAGMDLVAVNDMIRIVGLHDGIGIAGHTTWSYSYLPGGGASPITPGWYPPVESRVLAVPPGAPVNMEGYMMPAGVLGGAWAGRTQGQVVYWNVAAADWNYYSPGVGAHVVVRNEGIPGTIGLRIYCYDTTGGVGPFLWTEDEKTTQFMDDQFAMYGSIASGNAAQGWSTANTIPALVSGLGTGLSEIHTSRSLVGKNFRYPSCTYPTDWWASEQDPELGAQEYLRHCHDGDSAVYAHGAGYERHVVDGLYEYGKFVFSDQPGAPGSGVSFIVGDGPTTLAEGAAWAVGGTLAATLANLAAAVIGSGEPYTAWVVGSDTLVMMRTAVGPVGGTLNKNTLLNCVATPAGGFFIGGRAAIGGAPAHSPNHFFGGVFEAAGATHFTGPMNLYNTLVSVSTISTSQYMETTGLGAASGMRFLNGVSPSGWISPFTGDGLQIGVGTDANWHLILTTIENFGVNHGHSGASLYPVLFEHSQLHPENASPVEWWSHGHDRSGAYFDVQYGGFTWHSQGQFARGALTYTPATNPAVGKVFVLNGVIYTVNGVAPFGFTRGADANATLANLVACVLVNQGGTVRCWLNAATSNVFAEWKVAGPAGNAIPWSTDMDGATVDAATLGTNHAGTDSFTIANFNEVGLATFYGTLAVTGGTATVSSTTGATALNLNRLTTPAADGNVINTLSWKAYNTAASPALVTYGTLATEIQAPTENLYEAISKWSVCDVTATPSEYLRLDGTSTIKSIVASKPIYMNAASLNFGTAPGTNLASLQYSTASTKPVAVFGMPDISMLTVFCQQSDVGTNWLAADLTSPTLQVHAADATDLTKYMRLYHDGTNGYSMSGKGYHYISSGVRAFGNNIYASQFIFSGAGASSGLFNGDYGYCHSLKVDDGVFAALYAVDGTINNNYYFSTWANTVTASRQHTSGTPSTDPTVWVFATENPADVGGAATPHDQRHVFIIHDGDDAFIGTGVKTRGDLTIANRLIFAPHTAPTGAITGSAYADDGGLFGMNAAGAGLLSEAASATNPTLVPNRTNLADGIGSTAAGTVSVIAAGKGALDLNTAGVASAGTRGSLLEDPGSMDLVGDGTITLATGVAGYLYVWENTENGLFFVTSAGVVTLIDGTPNMDSADTDGKLCVYQSGTGAVIKNRLVDSPATSKIRWRYLYS